MQDPSATTTTTTWAVRTDGLRRLVAPARASGATALARRRGQGRRRDGVLPRGACGRCGSPWPSSASPPSLQARRRASGRGRSRCSATPCTTLADALTAVPLGIAFAARPPGSDPALHLRLRPRRGPGRRRHRRCHRRSRPCSPATRRSTGCPTRAGRPPVAVAAAGVCRLPRQRDRRPLPHPHRPPDRLRRAGRRRPARPHRRLHLAGRRCSAPAASRSAGGWPTRSSVC